MPDPWRPCDSLIGHLQFGVSQLYLETVNLGPAGIASQIEMMLEEVYLRVQLA